MPQKENSSYLQTAGRALQVLELFLNQGQLTLSQVSQALHLGPTIAYRLLFTLTEHGFLQQSAQGRGYQLGGQAIILGLTGLRNMQIYQVAHELLVAYYKQTGYTVSLTAYMQHRSVVLDHLSSLPDAEDTIFIGSNYEPQMGASHRILLAYLRPEQREQYMTFQMMGEQEQADLQAELDRIRARGYAYTEQTMTQGMWALALPLFDHSGELAAGVSTGDILCEDTQEEFSARLDSLRRLQEKINWAMQKKV